jgi:hypothetical protein
MHDGLSRCYDQVPLLVALDWVSRFASDFRPWDLRCLRRPLWKCRREEDSAAPGVCAFFYSRENRSWEQWFSSWTEHGLQGRVAIGPGVEDGVRGLLNKLVLGSSLQDLGRTLCFDFTTVALRRYPPDARKAVISVDGGPVAYHCRLSNRK